MLPQGKYTTTTKTGKFQTVNLSACQAIQSPPLGGQNGRLDAAATDANGAGRFLWAWSSDLVGRRTVFLAMFLLQAVLFWVMTDVSSFPAFTALAFGILLCYGGGFGTMPAFAADYFGPENVGSIYGLMLTAWGFAGVLGPTLIARIRQSSGHYTQALHMISIIVLVSAIIPLITRPPRVEQRETEKRLKAA